MPEQCSADVSAQYLDTFIASSISGFCGAYAAFFFEATKKRFQSDQALPSLFRMGFYRYLQETFRGSVSFASVTTPTMVVQQLSNTYCKNHFSPESSVNNVTALLSGALGGVVSTASENILLYQQLHQKKLKDAVKKLADPVDFRLFRGLWLIMFREAIFGFCYLSGVKKARLYAEEYWGERFVLPAQIMMGMFCAFISHPFDTIATTMQRYQYKHIHDAVGHLWNSSQSFRPFFKGVKTRMALFTTAVMTITAVEERVRFVLESGKKV